MRISFPLIILFFISTFSSISQELKDDQSKLERGEDVNVLYKNESSFGLYAHTAGGIGIAYRRGKHLTGKMKRMYELEAQNFKHPKEVKTINSYYENSKSFYFGKLNSFLIVRPGIGFQNVLFEKSDKKSVEIRYSYFVGATLAFAKPMYVEVKRNGSNPQDPPSTERYDPEIHKSENIYGKAPFFQGIEKSTVYPGGYAKVALSFEYSNRYNGLKAIETGAVVDVYPQALPMMAYYKNQQVFVSLYLKMIWGKKWF
jgi:hypothetical protein